jgi:hypothetical protein
MEKQQIALAARLLVKAQGTTFDAEAAALTGKAYRLLADALNSYDEVTASPGATRKRERRHLRDRRSVARPPAASEPVGMTEAAYDQMRGGDWIAPPSRSRVDLLI